jgi:hypothetical protein
MRFWPLVLALPLGLSSCGDKSAVSLTVVMDQATVTAQDGALGAALGGGFELKFALGPEASGSTTVTLGSFAVQNASGAALVDPVEVMASGASFPLVIEKGGNQAVTFTLSPKTLKQADRDALCAGQVKIVGTVMDSLKGGTDAVSSELLTPTCS